MTTGIAFFLNERLQEPKHHAYGWDWHVLDREVIHQDVIQIMINHSGAFTKALIGHEGICTLQPVGGLFDLAVKSEEGDQTFVEIKVDANWSDNQQMRQLEALKENLGSKLILILFSQRASKLSAEVFERYGHQSISRVSYSAIYNALDAAQDEGLASELLELVEGYRLALEAQEQRMNERWV